MSPQIAQAQAVKDALDAKDRIRVGIGVLILKDGKILLGKRKSELGRGLYAFPGGHLEYMESYEECARRETMEECGIEINNIRFQMTSNLAAYAPGHFVHIGMIADWKSGEPRVMEPDKCESWDWYAPDNAPLPLFLPAEQGIESLKFGYLNFHQDGTPERDKPKRGEEYRHYKGAIYTVTDVVRHSETQEEMVVYRDYRAPGNAWTRPLAMFMEIITVDGKTMPRFRRV